MNKITGLDVVKEARKFLGINYIYGGTTPNGFDCSGLTSYVYNNLGFNIGRTTYEQIKLGKKIYDKHDLLPGDLIFHIDSNKSPFHVLIYSGFINGKHMCIESPRTGLKSREIELYRWDGEARRIIINQLPTTAENNNKQDVKSNKFYRVVAGSYLEKNRAESELQKIKQKGFDVFLDCFIKDKKKFYRIVVGSYAVKENAETAIKNLNKSGFIAFIDIFYK